MSSKPGQPPPSYTPGQNGPFGSCKYKFENGQWVCTGDTSSGGISSGYTCPSPVSPGGNIPSGSEGDEIWVHAVEN